MFDINPGWAIFIFTIQELQSIGDDVEVLQPEWFRQEVKQVGENVVENYNRCWFFL